MDYISIENETELIQEVFKKYFEGHFGLYEDTTGTIKYGYLTKDRVELLVEPQLRKFIEEKTDAHVDIAYYAYKDNGFRGYTVELWKYRPYECIKQFKDLGDDLFQAYYKVALEIVKEEIKCK